MAGRDNFDPEVQADRALVCSRDGSHREIWTSRRSPEAEIGLQAGDKAGLLVGDKVGLLVGDKAGDRIRNLRKHRTPILLPNQLSKARRKNRRMNNAETLKQCNRPAVLPI